MQRILIIEDEPDLRDELNEMLCFEGFQVLKATNGKQGLDLARKEIPDVIVCDIVMPDMEGFEVIDHLKLNEATRLIPLIFITAHSEWTSLRRGMDLGADDYLIKPFTRMELINTINARLTKASAIETKINAVRNRVVKSLPHEFRTPLNAIMGFSEILHYSSRAQSAGEISEMAGHIYKSGADLLCLTEKYLMYIDLVINKDKSTLEEVEQISPLIKDTASATAQKHGRPDDIEITIEKASLVISKTRFPFALREIIDNAFKFSEKGEKVRVSAYHTGASYTIRVDDYGIGFSALSSKGIDPFPYLSESDYAGQGSGLGLFLAREIIESNFSKINIESNQGEGTSVFIVVPKIPDMSYTGLRRNCPKRENDHYQRTTSVGKPTSENFA